MERRVIGVSVLACLSACWTGNHAATRPGPRTAAVASPASASAAPDETSGRSPVLAGVLSFGIPVATIAVLPAIDAAEPDAHGAARTALHAVGWSAIALFVAAPTLGAVYAGDPWSTGTMIRVAGAALFGIGAVLFVTEPNRSSESLTGREGAGALIGTAGALGYLTGMVVEGVHSIRVAARRERPARASVSAGTLHGGTSFVPAVIVSGTW